MGAGHDHAVATNNRKRLIIAAGITGTFFLVEVIGAIITSSLALLVDAAHMLTDLVGLLMAVFAASISLRPPSNKHTFGFKRAEIISALAQALLLFAVGVYALIEGIRRLSEPVEVASNELIIFGVIGLVANLTSYLVLQGGQKKNLNMKAARLEVLNDALGSIGVIVAALVITFTGFEQADSIVAIGIALLIIPRTIILLTTATSVLLESTPAGLDLDQLRQHILEVDDVESVHDVHAWQISSDLPVLTAHVVVADQALRDGKADQILTALQVCVAQHFEVSIEHSTFQIESTAHAAEEADFHR